MQELVNQFKEEDLATSLIQLSKTLDFL